MQSYTTELTNAQSANGKVPYVQATAYTDQMPFTQLASSGWTPPAGEVIMDSDSCIINSSTYGKGLLTIFLTYKSSTSTANYYWRFVPEADFGTAAYWQIANLLFSTTSASGYAEMQISVNSDNYVNGTSDYFTINYGYILYNSGTTNFEWHIFTKVCQFTAAYPSAPAVPHTYTVQENIPYSALGLLFFSIVLFYAGGSVCIPYGVSGIYDSVTATGLQFWASNYGQAGQSSTNYQFSGDFSLKFTTIGGATSGLGTDGTIYSLPFPMMGSYGRISTVYVNGICYGALQGYFQDIPGNSVRLWGLNNKTGQFEVYPFQVSGPQDFTNGSSSITYGPSDCKLSLANFGFNQSSYPTLSQMFVLNYSYQGVGINFSESVESSDFIHWGNRRMIDGANLVKCGFFSIDSNYLLIKNLDQDAYITVRSVTITDISNDIVNVQTSRQSDGSAAQLTITLKNNYIGSGASSPNLLYKDGYIKVAWGYNTTSGNEALVDAWYMIDTIQQNTAADNNLLVITARDAMKKLVNTQYSYQLQFESQIQIFYGAISDQILNNDFSQFGPDSWKHDNTSIYIDLANNDAVNNAFGSYCCFTQHVSPSFSLQADITVGSQGGVGTNINGAMEPGFIVDFQQQNDNSNPFNGYIFSMGAWTLVSGTTYSFNAVINVLPYTGSYFTFTTQSFNVDLSKAIHVEMRRVGDFIMFFVNGNQVAFNTWYGDLHMKTYNLPVWVGSDIYVLDEVNSNGILTPIVGLYARWNSSSGSPPTGSATPEFHFSNIELVDYNIVRSNDFNMQDIAAYGGIPGGVSIQKLFTDNFSSITNWQQTI